jgi:hypothetical protein
MTPRDRYIRDHAPTLLLVQAVRATPGAKLDLEAAIRTAGALHDRLDTACGSGAPAAIGRLPEGPLEDAASGRGRPSHTTRKTADNYGALDAESRAGFDRFYAAYGHPKGKQRAAARWAEIAPDAALTAHIVAAAAQDRAQPRPPDAVRKWPEGWLSERRWADAPLPGAPAQVSPEDRTRAQIAELLAERAALKRLARAGDARILAELAEVEARLAGLGVSGTEQTGS